MNAILLSLVVLFVCLQSVAKKAYNERVSGGVYSFTAGSIIFALIVFVVIAKGKLNFNIDVLMYAILFAISYFSASVFSFLAISTGSLSLSSLIIQYSLVVPTFYGLIALDEPIKATLILGIFLLCISLIFVNLEGKGEKKITLKWGMFAFLAFLGNGMCSTVQKVQQLDFGGMYKSEFMIIALFMNAVALVILSFVTEKKQTVVNYKKGFWLYAACGIANGVTNLLVMILSNTVPASVMFPVIAAGGIILTALISMFVYKEKLSTQQKIGFALGVLAIVLLNI